MSTPIEEIREKGSDSAETLAPFLKLDNVTDRQIYKLAQMFALFQAVPGNLLFEYVDGFVLKILALRAASNPKLIENMSQQEWKEVMDGGEH